jgi:hypothetical protein
MSGVPALDAPEATRMTIITFFAISWYNALVLHVLMFKVFKRYNKIYFYSMLATLWGIILHQLGFLLRFFGIVRIFAASYAVVVVGWFAMVRMHPTSHAC